MPSTKEKNKFKNNVKAPAMKYSPVKRDNRSEIKTTPAKEENKSSGGSYASAKKNDPKLDSYIKARNDAKKNLAISQLKTLLKIKLTKLTAKALLTGQYKLKQKLIRKTKRKLAIL